MDGPDIDVKLLPELEAFLLMGEELSTFLQAETTIKPVSVPEKRLVKVQLLVSLPSQTRDNNAPEESVPALTVLPICDQPVVELIVYVLFPTT
jgi:hypothetical protein